MKSLRDIEKSIKNFKVKPNSETQNRILEQTLDAQRKLKKQSVSETKLRIIMKNRITKLAVAAVILVAAGLLLYNLKWSVDMSTPAFGNVLAQLKKVRSVYYKSVNFYDKTPPHSTEEMLNEDGIKRKVLGWGAVIIFDFRNGITLQLNTKNKRAFRSLHTPRLEAAVINSLDFLTNIHEKGARFAGKELLDGIETDLYIDEQPLKFQKTTIWVNPLTNLPVKVIRETTPPNDSNYLPIKTLSLEAKDFGSDTEDELTLDISGTFTPQYSKKIYSDFKWNVDLAPELFSTEIPPDYNEQHQVVMPEPNETVLIETLEFWSEMSDGSFPTDANDLMDPNKIKPMLIKKFANEPNARDAYHKAGDFVEIIRAADIFVEKKIISKNWYANKTSVFFGQADKPLYWWKNEDSNNYSIIYGDLSIGEMSKMPE